MKVIFSANALKQLKKLDKPTSSRIVAYMAEVAKLQNPRDRGKMLVGNLLGDFISPKEKELTSGC